MNYEKTVALFSESNSANHDVSDQNYFPDSPFSQFLKGLSTDCPDLNAITSTFQTTAQTVHPSSDPVLLSPLDHETFNGVDLSLSLSSTDLDLLGLDEPRTVPRNHDDNSLDPLSSSSEHLRNESQLTYTDESITMSQASSSKVTTDAASGSNNSNHSINGCLKAATTVDPNFTQSKPVTDRISDDDTLVGQSGETVGGLIDLNRQLIHTNSINYPDEEIATFMSTTEASKADESQISMNWQDKNWETTRVPVLEDSATIEDNVLQAGSEPSPSLIACTTEDDISKYFQGHFVSSTLEIGSSRRRKKPNSHTLEELRDVVVPELEKLLKYHEEQHSDECIIRIVQKILSKRKNNIHVQMSKSKKKKETESVISKGNENELELTKIKEQHDLMRAFLFSLTQKPGTEVSETVKTEILKILAKNT